MVNPKFVEEQAQILRLREPRNTRQTPTAFQKQVLPFAQDDKLKGKNKSNRRSPSASLRAGFRLRLERAPNFAQDDSTNLYPNSKKSKALRMTAKL
jgi:hypothetical protein